MRGSRRNHAHWRRAKARVRRTASSTACSRGTPSSTCASSSRYPSAWRAVRDSPPGRRARARTSSTKPRPEQVLEALLDAGVVDGRVEADAHQREGRGRVGVEPGPERREGAARAQRDLEGAHHPAPVGRFHAGRGHGVEIRQPGVQALGTPRALRLHLERGSHLREPPWHRQPVDHGAQVEPGAAHEQGPSPSPVEVLEHGGGLGLEPAQCELLVGVDEVHQVVGNFGALGRTRLGRADVHAPVHAHRVDRHQLGFPASPRQRQRQCGLPRRRRPHQARRDRARPRRDVAGRRARPAPGPYRAETGMRMRRRAGGGDAHQLAAQVMWRGARDADLRVGAGRRDMHVGWGEVHELVLARPTREHLGVPRARPFDDDLLDAADAGLVPGEGGALHHHTEPLEPLGHHVRRGRRTPSCPPPWSRVGARR